MLAGCLKDVGSVQPKPQQLNSAEELGKCQRAAVRVVKSLEETFCQFLECLQQGFGIQVRVKDLSTHSPKPKTLHPFRIGLEAFGSRISGVGPEVHNGVTDLLVRWTPHPVIVTIRDNKVYCFFWSSYIPSTPLLQGGGPPNLFAMCP